MRLPPVSHLDSFSIVADDIESAWLRLLAVEPVDTRSLTFFRDVIYTLSGSSEMEWLDDSYQLVQNIFKDAGVRNYLTNASREDFCVEYHHHMDGKLCYTAAAEYHLSTSSISCTPQMPMMSFSRSPSTPDHRVAWLA